MASRLKKITASGVIHTGKAYLKGAYLSAAGDAATAILEDGTDGNGTDLLRLSANAANQSAPPWQSTDSEGVFCGTGIYAAITGTTPHLTVEYEPVT